MIFNNSEDLSRLLNKSRDEILSSYVWKSEWLKLNCYANAIFALHQKVFSKYRHCHVGEDVVIVACGPSARHAPVIHGAKYLAVNRALFDQRYKFDYFFTMDMHSSKDCVELAATCGSKNFVGNYMQLWLEGTSLERWTNVIPDVLMERMNPERFYMGYAVDPFYDISILPLFDRGTIAHPALNFALWTNPRRIYLIGSDCSNAGYAEVGRKQPTISEKHHKDIIIGYHQLKKLRDYFCPNVEIISINPVELKGLFKDIYTEGYLSEHEEIAKNDVEIIKEADGS